MTMDNNGVEFSKAAKMLSVSVDMAIPFIKKSILIVLVSEEKTTAIISKTTILGGNDGETNFEMGWRHSRCLVVGRRRIFDLFIHHLLSRPDDQALKVKNQQSAQFKPGQTYTAMTYNIGYGSYPPSYSFSWMAANIREPTVKVRAYQH